MAHGTNPAIDGWVEAPPSNPYLCYADNRPFGATLACALFAAALFPGHPTPRPQTPPAESELYEEIPLVAPRREPRAAPRSELYRRVIRYCESHRIDFQEALDVASHIQPPTPGDTLTPQEEAHALMIAATLLEVQNDAHPFYARPEYRRFIDTVLQKIREGKLSLDLSRTSPVHKGLYMFGENTIYLYRPIDMESFISKSTILHELFHFYQDILGNLISYVESEEVAYMLGADYILISARLQRMAVMSQRPHSVPAFALRIFDARSRGDQARAESEFEGFREAIIRMKFEQFLELERRRPQLHAEQSHLLQAAITNVRDEASQRAFLDSLRQDIHEMSAQKERQLQTLRSTLQSLESNGDVEAHLTAVRLYREVIGEWLRIIHRRTLEDIVSRHSSGAAIDNELRRSRMILAEHPLYDDMFAELNALRAMSIISPIDGVE